MIDWPVPFDNKFIVYFIVVKLLFAKKKDCGGNESDKSQERTDLLSEGTGLIHIQGR